MSLNFQDISGFSQDISTQSKSDGGFDAGDGANLALDAAASAIPFGSLVKGFLDDLGLQQNIDNVLKYGLSSWGASTTPEEMKSSFAQTVYPYMKEKFESIKAENLEQVLNEVDTQIRANMYYRKALRDHHSRAKSTRLANDWAYKELKKLLDQGIGGLLAQFEKQGVKIKKETIRPNTRSLDINNIINGNPFTAARDFDRYLAKTYYKYSVDYSSLQNVEVDENGNVKKKSSNLGLVATLAGLGFAIFKGN